MRGISVCEIGTGAGPSFSEESDTKNSVSRLVLSNNSLYNLYSFAQELVYLEKKSLIKDGMYGAENDISLCIAQKVVFIVLISN